MNILLLGQETNFRPLLMEALKQAGHGWQLAAIWENAVALIQQHTFDCVMLSNSLASEMIEEFIELLNQVCPACHHCDFRTRRNGLETSAYHHSARQSGLGCPHRVSRSH
jgi:DNA-binding NtrC family response regulator